jgi:hypothetical protein
MRQAEQDQPEPITTHDLTIPSTKRLPECCCVAEGSKRDVGGRGRLDSRPPDGQQPAAEQDQAGQDQQGRQAVAAA